ncbi:MAG: tyrosine-type recombinase/integrase [Spirochaetia bacterium]|nr:tyrosine-type recombinase/integrase [Spirochaetia bacterium]
MLSHSRTFSGFPESGRNHEAVRRFGWTKKNPEAVRDRLILKSLYVLGLRVSELCSLEMEHLQLEEGFVRVTGKGSKVRLIPIYPEAAEEIRDFVNEVRPFFNPGTSERGIFLSRLGKPLSRVSVWKILKKKAAETGVRATVHPHTLRHSFATHLIQNGADIRTVQELLGHTNVRTTEIYTHLAPEKLREDLRRYHPFYR